MLRQGTLYTVNNRHLYKKLIFLAVEDFYTHANWNELFPRENCSCFRTETFWQYLDNLPDGLHTGAWPCKDCDDRGNDPSVPQHGHQCEGENQFY